MYRTVLYYELKVERIARANLFSKLQLLELIVGKKVARNEKPLMHINKNKTRATKKVGYLFGSRRICLFFLQLHLASSMYCYVMVAGTVSFC